MMVKKCCVQKCASAANREEDRGVTFHKLPNSVEVRNLWVRASRITTQLGPCKWYYVCSRHFRKGDFQMLKGSKFVLKSGSVPTIFPWSIDVLNSLNKSTRNLSQSHNMATKSDNVDAIMEGNSNENLHDDGTATDKLAGSGSSINTEVVQNSNQKDEIERNTNDWINTVKNSEQNVEELSMDSQGSSLTDDVKSTESGLTLKADLKANKVDSENPLPLIEGMKSDARMMKKIINRTAFKGRGTKRKRKGRVGGGTSRMTASNAASVASIDRGVGTMALSVGSKVEVKDFGDQWHPARILEVDYDEMEVLVHYDNLAQRSDEWISVSSPRLRPAAVPPPRVTSVRVKTPGRATPPPLVYRLGERCLAKWSDNRRFLATVRAVLDDGQYEIIFDDGFVRVCKANLLSKLKQPESDVNAQMSTDRSNASSPIDLPLNLPPAPILYHKHLFDPSRDYLGSKKERREMKRKLNVKELFSAKKRRSEPATKASKPKLKWKPERKKAKAPVVRKRQKIDFTGDAIPSTSAVVEDSGTEKKVVEESIGEKEEKALEAPTEAVGEIPEQPANTITTEEPKPPEPITPMEEKPPKPETNIDNTAMECTLTETVLAAPQPQIKLERIRQKKETKRAAKRDRKTERMKVKIQFKRTKAKKQAVNASKVKDILAEDSVGAASSTMPELSAEDILRQQKEIEEVVLGEGEWCCRWMNGQPVGVVSEIEAQVLASEVSDGSSASQQPLARRSVQVEDKRLPEGWTKHMVRRSLGNSAGKWDVVLVCPEGRRFRTRLEMRTYLDEQAKSGLKTFEDCLLDFGVHRKRAKRLGWDRTSSDVTQDPVPITLPANSLSAITSPIGRKKKLKLSLKKKDVIKIPPKAVIKRRRRGRKVLGVVGSEEGVQPGVVQSDGIKVDESLVTISTGNVALGGESQTLPAMESSPLEEGYVYVGSLKVQMIDNLYYRCPKEGCLKNFRKDNLLRMHIKHYHREMRKLMGVTPKVADLAYARTVTEDPPAPTPKSKSDAEKVHKPKTPKVPKVTGTDTPVLPKKDIDLMHRELFVNTDTVDVTLTPLKSDVNKYETLEDSPKLRNALENELPTKKPQVQSVKLEFKEKSELEDSKIKLELLDNTVQIKEIKDESLGNNKPQFMDEDNIDEEGFKLRFDDEKSNEYMEDYEKSISAYTVPKEIEERPVPVEVPKVKRNKHEKKRLSQWKDGVKVSKKRRKPNVGVQRKLHSELDMWETFTSDADEMQSSFGDVGQHSRSSDKKTASLALALPQNMEEMVSAPLEPTADNMFITESGEKIRIVRMKREEIINCHCGYGEEDGLMVQCELCLCWQHAICHNIERESQVPEKYICAICTNPRRGRRSARWLHEQGWLYEGTLPSWAASGGSAGAGRAAALRRSHELVGNLLLLADALHAMRVKMQVAGKKDHPKLYLWSRSWEQPNTQEVAPEAIITETVSMDDDLVDMPKLDLNNIMESEVGKENCPISKLPSEHSHDVDPAHIRDGGSGDAEGTALAGLLGGNDALRLPISTSELERLAKSVQDSNVLANTPAPPFVSSAPEPEKAIDWAECRLRLLQHIERAQAAIDARLDSIEAQVAELESQDPSLEDDETADFYPQTKQTIQMLVRDLNTMEELALIT